MQEKKSNKTNKNLYLPDWVIEQLDFEARRYGGPGVVAATCIYTFCRLPETKKKELLQEYRKAEIEAAYAAEDEAAAAHDAEAARHKQRRTSSKAG